MKLFFLRLGPAYESNEHDEQNLAQFSAWVWSTAGIDSAASVAPDVLLKQFRSGLLVFLRQAALFFHALTLIPAPEALKGRQDLMHLTALMN